MQRSGCGADVCARIALIRALVRTGAKLVVVEQEKRPLEDEVGVLLRYTDPGCRSDPSPGRGCGCGSHAVLG
ncbi:hypothetical protein SAZ11_04250 [Streptomyces sp. FXJ1.4098]|nr:hypothetical protein [Streptomyces sp. FXJ1.4098]